LCSFLNKPTLTELFTGILTWYSAFYGLVCSSHGDWHSMIAGQSGDQVPVGMRFFVPSRLVPRPTQLPVQWVLCTFQGKVASVGLTMHLLLALRCKWVGIIPLPPLCTCQGMSWSDLHLIVKCFSNNMCYKNLIFHIFWIK
jgi:hypothetical protein